MTHDEAAEFEPSACINCGRCVEVCPSRLVPKKLAILAGKHDGDGFVENGGLECMECGCCGYICPAKRHLTQSIKAMRKEMLASVKRNSKTAKDAV